MKRILAIVLACLLLCAPALGEEVFRVPAETPSDANLKGVLVIDEEAGAIPVVFAEEAENVVISHTDGASLTVGSVKAGDMIVVYSYIPDTLPNLSVSYSLPGDEDEIRYTRMISLSGKDSSYIIMEDWYTTYAWFTAKRMLRLMNDDAYLTAILQKNEEILSYIRNVCASLPEEMPENYYFLSLSFLEPIMEQKVKEEGIQIDRENFAYLMRGLPQMIISSLVGREGVIATAASSLMTASEYLVIPDIPFEPGFVVLDDGGEYVIIVSLSLAGDGIACFRAGVVSREVLTSLIHMDSLLLGAVG